MHHLQSQADGLSASATSAETPLESQIVEDDESGMEEIEGDESGMEEDGDGNGMEEDGDGNGMAGEEENEENGNESEDKESERDGSETDEERGEDILGPRQYRRRIYFGPMSSMPDETVEEFDTSRDLRGGSSGDDHPAGREEGEDEGEKKERRKNAVSRRVLGAAYFVMKASMGPDGLEAFIKFLSDGGADWGDNPSAITDSEMPRIRKAFGDAVLHFVAHHVDRSPCVSWVVDTVKVDDTWLQIIALIVLVPEAAAKDLVQSLVIGVPEIDKYEGACLASQWAQIAARIGITDTKKLASVCAGGEFHSVDAPAMFLVELAASQADSTQSSDPPAVPCLWDGAHLTDRADGEARYDGWEAARLKDRADDEARYNGSCPWVNETLETIKRITRPQPFWCYSNWYELPFSAVHLWYDTRYPVDGNILEAFTKRTPRFIGRVRARLAEPETYYDLDELESDLQLLTGEDNTLLVRVAALTDIYGVLSRASKTLRSLNLLPWERQAIVKEMVEKLKLMKATLRTLGQDSMDASGQDSASPDRALASGQCSAASGENPAASGENSATSGENPAASGENYATSGENPAASGENSATSDENSATSGENSATSGENSATSGENSATSGENSATSGENPTASGENSATSGQRSRAGDNQETTRGSPVEVTNGDELQARWPALAKHAHTLTTEQVAEMLTFLEVLSERCSEREVLKYRRGATEDTQNKKLVDAMDNIRAVADLQSLRRSESPDISQTIQAALRRLESGHIIPATDINNDCIKATCDAIKRTEEGLSNQEVFKKLWEAAKTQPELKPYVDIVIRLWLISPPEALVESIAIAAKEVFGELRELDHEAAATDLIVRWNGPEADCVDGLVKYVQEKHQFDFCGGGEETAMEGEKAESARSEAEP